MKQKITLAQRNAVTALDLPFDLTDDQIARQFTPEGHPIPLNERSGAKDPRARARELAQEALARQNKKLKAA